MVSAAPVVFPEEGLTLTGFEPDGPRAAFLDQRMRGTLAQSLRYIFQQGGPLLTVPEEQREAFYRRLESDGVSPLAFSFYCDAVLAIERDDLEDANRLLTALMAIPPHPGGPLVSPLPDPRTHASGARYCRLIDTDPSFKFEVFAPREEDFTRCRRTIHAAMALLAEGDPAQSAEIHALLREIILAAGSQDAKALTFDGASSFMMWGGIVLNVQRSECPVAMAQMIVHEATHNLMFGLCTDQPLIENADDELFSSPLRPDPRPMDGIYHATFVTARMFRVVKCLLDSGTLTDAQSAAAAKDLAENGKLFANGIQTVREHARLTGLGRDLMAGAEAYMREQGF